MINREATIRWKGYDPNDLSPKSHKRVWANCDDCGDGRWVYMSGYRELCRKCAVWRTIEVNRAAQLKYNEDHPEKSINHSKHMVLLYKNGTHLGERHSAILQGQDYDAGEWNGYTDKSRPHLLPIPQCMHINERFVGSEGHHFLKDAVVFIPAELHKHIKHDIKTGENMGEINALAIQFINGGL